jgi:hypothetical protein
LLFTNFIYFIHYLTTLKEVRMQAAASNDGTARNNELERMWKAVVVASFKELSRRFFGANRNWDCKLTFSGDVTAPELMHIFVLHPVVPFSMTATNSVAIFQLLYVFALNNT